MKKILHLLSSLFLVITTPLHANVALYLFLNNREASNIIIITAGFFLYSLCIYIATRSKKISSFVQACVISFIANLFSALIGIIIASFLAFTAGPESWVHSLFYSTLPHLYRSAGENLILGQLTLNNILFLLAYWILLSLINTLLTFWIFIIAYPHISKRRIVLWTFIANALSIGFGIFFVGIYKYLYGSYPF